MLTPQSVNAIVVHLERAGLVERRADARDQRLRRIYVSQSGRHAGRRPPAVRAVEERMVASMTAAEQATFRHQLTDARSHSIPATTPPNQRIRDKERAERDSYSRSARPMAAPLLFLPCRLLP